MLVIVSSVASVVLILAISYLVLRGRQHAVLNKTLSGATNSDGNQTRWLRWQNSLYVKPIVGYYKEEIRRDLPKISGYFEDSDTYSFVLPPSWFFRKLGYRFKISKDLRPGKRPKNMNKWSDDDLLRPGKTDSEKEILLGPEALTLVLGAPDSGKSKISYEMLEQLGNKKGQQRIYVVDLTRAFPKRICLAAKAKRITSLDALHELVREIKTLHDIRLSALDRYDVDHVQNVPNDEHKIPVWIILEEGHATFDKNQDLKSEYGKKVKEVADLINEIILVGRKLKISFVYLSQSALKSETLVNLGRSRTIISGYLAISESQAVGLEHFANNPKLAKGTFVIRSRDTGPVPVTMLAWYRDDSALNVPADGEAAPSASAAAGPAAL